ncbi:MAG: NAD(P)/FAD-dependent oxidoreductase [Bacteroidales bacterium]|nr:NAD(P)/FAD-dependent oxidoreductase [Bacteroidales bacterium]
MITIIQLVLNPKEYKEVPLQKILARYLKIDEKRITSFRIIRKSIDARKPEIKIVLRIEVTVDEIKNTNISNVAFQPKLPLKNGNVIIVGMGPAGLFASLQLLARGIKPIIIEQGNDVHQRKRDIALMYRTNTVNEISNYCFGEGGAGTFSDGKLYSRSVKRGNIEWFLQTLVQAGASDTILYESHPHIGSDKLPIIIENIRKWILNAGGEIYFSCQMTDLIIENDECKGITVNTKDKIYADAVILASGHSSRYVYDVLFHKGLSLQPKGFAVGVRLEHKQDLINLMQYHGSSYIKYLPPAEYAIVEQINGRGVYSFCMCPGGSIVPAMTEKETIVVNGMSSSKRNSPFANSGFVVEIRTEDIAQQATATDMLSFQHELEKNAFKQANDGLKAPAQRVIDFLHNKVSTSLPKTSYIPGVVSSPFHEWLPLLLREKLTMAFQRIQKRMPLFINDDVLMIGIESRTSSPVRIPRNENTFEHVQIKHLYPCGEGAGYAGGITSSALDGINVANAVYIE